jgi:hypothetical protein
MNHQTVLMSTNAGEFDISYHRVDYACPCLSDCR